MKPITMSGLTFTWNKKCSCYQFSLPPRLSCPGVGERLKNPQSICNYCYAYYGRLKQMKTAMKTLTANRRTVVREYYWDLFRSFRRAFVELPLGQKFFRWFGCGDGLSTKLWEVIEAVAFDNPQILFWAPTQTCVVLEGIKNLSVRPTQPLIGLPAPAGGHTTLLPEQKSLPGHFICPGKCDPCRACWDKKVSRIAFPFHGSACLMARFKKMRRENKF